MNKIKINTGIPYIEPVEFKCRYAGNHINNIKECCRDCENCEWSDITIKTNEESLLINELVLIKNSIDRHVRLFPKMINRVEILKFIANKGSEISDVMDKFTSLCDYTTTCYKSIDIDFSLLYSRLDDVFSTLSFITKEVDNKQYCNYYNRFNEQLTLLNNTIDNFMNDIKKNNED